MSAEDKKIMALLRRFRGDTREALRENKQLDVLYALAPLRENVLEWYDFRPDAQLLQIGADFGALTGLFLRKTAGVTVADSDPEALELVRARYPEAGNLTTEAIAVKGADSGKLRPGSFDYVTVIGTFLPGESLESQVRRAVSYLCEGGTLLLAVQNRYGLKYLAGVAGDPVTACREELLRLLPGAEIRYPMPDYRTASEIWSDGWQPTTADVAGMLPLYDFPRYPSVNVGSVFAAACQDGKFRDFADSYLAIWKKESQNG
jgi:SAM-dependent methyltransferase